MVGSPYVDHRNPSMPVIRNYLMADGSRKTEIDPDYERRYREHMMTTASYPNWRDDPTYEIRKDKHK